MSAEEGSGVGGMRIVTLTVVVRAGDPEWSDIKTTCDVEVEEGWPETVALAAAQGGLNAALNGLRQTLTDQNGTGRRKKGDSGE